VTIANSRMIDGSWQQREAVLATRPWFALWPRPSVPSAAQHSGGYDPAIFVTADRTGIGPSKSAS
jgi:hypothetical protein